uniref:Secreted protein n=1 Tax=Acrobeloides nanus TaxID=290746 RepID=A0A914EFN0_9BILA
MINAAAADAAIVEVVEVGAAEAVEKVVVAAVVVEAVAVAEANAVVMVVAVEAVEDPPEFYQNWFFTRWRRLGGGGGYGGSCGHKRRDTGFIGWLAKRHLGLGAPRS